MLKFHSTLLLFILSIPVQAQELFCQVSVLTPQIQSSDKRIYTTLQTSIMEFMNNTKWTQDRFLNQERIECTIQITIDDRPSNDEFTGKIQVQSNRPIFKSSYSSPVFTFRDEDFKFRYLEDQTLEFNESGSNPNLQAVLAFYAYIIIGIDYDTYSFLGGNPYLVKAQNIVALMQSAGEPGWKAFEKTRNRYWLAENLNNPIFRPVRQLYYDYHRKGLDLMTEKKDDAINVIAGSIEGLKKVHQERPSSFLMQLLFDAKSDEIVNILSQAFPEVKTRMYNYLVEWNPSNSSKYQQLLKN